MDVASESLVGIGVWIVGETDDVMKLHSKVGCRWRNRRCAVKHVPQWRR